MNINDEFLRWFNWMKCLMQIGCDDVCDDFTMMGFMPQAKMGFMPKAKMGFSQFVMICYVA